MGAKKRLIDLSKNTGFPGKEFVVFLQERVRDGTTTVRELAGLANVSSGSVHGWFARRAMLSRQSYDLLRAHFTSRGMVPPSAKGLQKRRGPRPQSSISTPATMDAGPEELRSLLRAHGTLRVRAWIDEFERA